MKLPEGLQKTGITTMGGAGIALMVLHIMGHLTGWAWPILYVCMILMGIASENSNKVRI
jgi:hypothetical protein